MAVLDLDAFHIHAVNALGRPYRPFARGPLAFYGIGLWLYLLEKATGIRIEDPFAAPSGPSGFLDFGKHFVRLPDLGSIQTLDVLWWRRGPGYSDLGVVENDRHGLCISVERGVHRRPLLELMVDAEKAHRLKELA